ncbi:unnamed protein product, partial [Effrenium voratum]
MVVAVMCFFLGFIPEVGSVISVVVPVPILLFDSRVSLEVRATNVLTMAVGMLLIKFMVSNGLESYLMSKSPTLAGQREGENQPASETHPVIILFVVILCGEIWGITGMLISVPLLALIRLLINLENTHPGRVTAAAAASAKAVVPSVNPTPRKTSGASASYVSEVARNESLNGRRNSKYLAYASVAQSFAKKGRKGLSDQIYGTSDYIEYTGRLPKHLLRMPKDLSSGAFYSH